MMSKPTLRLLLLATAALAGPASSHVTLEQPRASAGSVYKAVLRIGHGCEGSPTHTVTVRLPDGFRGARPMPKPGWSIDIRKAALAQPYDSHGRTVTEDVIEVSWRAASREAWLDDAWYDEFSVRGQLPAQPGPLWFKVQQVCASGRWDWADVPASGTSTRGLKAPAVLLDVLPAETGGHNH